MKFSEVQGPAYFVVIKLDSAMLLLAKDREGGIRDYRKYDEIDCPDIGDDTEVQVVDIGKTSE